ncbi:MAG: twin-arginine translocation signal domain-containing protein, partial [Anaerolineae bacterium]
MSAKSLSRRQFLKLAAGLGGAAALAACAPSPAPAAEPAKPAEPTKPAAAPAPAGKVELTVAHAWEAAFMPHQEAWDKTLMAKYPNITIKNINSAWAEHNRIVPTWAAANQLPDIIYVHGSRAFPWNR